MLDRLKSEQEQLRAEKVLQEKAVELSVRAGSELRLADKQVEIFIQKTTKSPGDTTQKILIMYPTCLNGIPD